MLLLIAKVTEESSSLPQFVGSVGLIVHTSVRDGTADPQEAPL